MGFFHPGEVEEDEESWPDHDERVHGRIDTKQNRRDYPEGFVWTCCGGGLTSPGCKLRGPTDVKQRGDTGSVSSDTASGVERDGHPGELEVNWEAWPDHDEDVHGEIDTAANRRDHPDGFVWSCCGKDADGSACDDGGEEEEDDEEEGEEQAYGGGGGGGMLAGFFYAAQPPPPPPAPVAPAFASPLLRSALERASGRQPAPPPPQQQAQPARQQPPPRSVEYVDLTE